MNFRSAGFLISLLPLVSACISDAMASNPFVANRGACEYKVCSPPVGGGWSSAAAGAPSCLDEEGAATTCQFLRWDTQFGVHCDADAILFPSMAPIATTITINTTTKEVADTDSGIGFPDIDDDATNDFDSGAQDGRVPVWVVPAGGVRTVSITQAQFIQRLAVGKRCGVCVDGTGATNGRPCDDSANACNDDETSGFNTCRGCGADTTNVDYFNRALGGFFYSECVAGTCLCTVTNE